MYEKILKISEKLKNEIISNNGYAWISEEDVYKNGLPSKGGPWHKTSKGWSNYEKDETTQILSHEDMSEGLTAIYEHAIKNNIDIENIPADMKKKYVIALNSLAKDREIDETFDEKRFDELFNKFLDETGKRKKKRKKKRREENYTSDIFSKKEEILSDLMSNGERIIGDELENIDSLNDTFKIKHKYFESIFKPEIDIAEYMVDNESYAFIIDQIIGTNVVPPTIVSNRNINGRNVRGSEQFFIESASTLKKVKFTEPERLRKISETEKFRDQIERMSILDYIIGSQDRHIENLIFDDEDNIFAIDNGNCLYGGDGFITISFAIGILENHFLKGLDIVDSINKYAMYDDDELTPIFDNYSFSESSKKLIDDIDVEKISKSIEGMNEKSKKQMIKRIEKLKKLISFF